MLRESKRRTVGLAARVQLPQRHDQRRQPPIPLPASIDARQPKVARDHARAERAGHLPGDDGGQHARQRPLPVGHFKAVADQRERQRNDAAARRPADHARDKQRVERRRKEPAARHTTNSASVILMIFDLPSRIASAPRIGWPSA